MKKVSNNFINTTVVGILFLVFFISIGWASLNSNLYIDSKALVRITTDTSITGFNYSSGTTGVLATNNFYSNKDVMSTLYLPLSTSTVTYTVEVTNMQLDTGVAMGIKSITGLPNNMEIVEPMTGYTLKEKICDDIDPTDCGSGSQKTFSFTIRYKENGYDANNLDYNLHLVFEFKEVYDITYSGFTNAPSSPLTVIEGELPTISLASDAPSVIAVLMGGNRLVQGTDYTFSNYVVTFLTNIDDDIIIVKPIIYNITYVLNGGTQAENQVTTYYDIIDEDILPATKVGYEFDGWYTDENFTSDVITNTSQLSGNATLYANFTGVSYAFFMQYDASDANGQVLGITKTSINKFERSTLTWNEVAIINNKTDVSNQVAGDYLSSVPVYVWTETSNNVTTMYWWSEAEKVYFHPDTRNAFENCTNITSIDLNGTDTSLVKNFSHWFNNNQILETIAGKIVTTGVVDSDDGTFNYGSDSNNNSSSHNGMTYMFNDCKKLKSVDLSGIVTSNVVDMKRMFGGCIELTNIDVSHFDTSKVKSMYWMFRNCQHIKELDLSNFDTRNVVNMSGMFLSCAKLYMIKLGSLFITSNVKRFNTMFSSCNALTIIFAENDFDTSSKTNSSDMFKYCSKLVGAIGTNYSLSWTSSMASNTNYAKICTSNQQGLFTSYNLYYLTGTISSIIETRISQKAPYIYSYAENVIPSNPTYTTLDTFDGNDIDKLDVYYFNGDLGRKYANVLLDGNCWLIIRTTDTGNIKLLYNGVAQNNACESDRAPSKGMIGGTFGQTSLNSTLRYGDSISYDVDTGVFTLNNTFTAKWSNNDANNNGIVDYNELIGMWTCKSSNSTCTEIYFVADYYNNSKANTVQYTIGELARYDSVAITPYAGTGQTLKVFGYKISDYPHKVKNANTTGLYGNSVIWQSNHYELITTTTLSNPDDTHHFYCYDAECTSVRYYYAINKGKYYYVSIEDGVLNPLKETLNYKANDNEADADVNAHNSSIKAVNDAWYTHNMTAISSIVDNDAVYCNNRKITNLHGWDINTSIEESTSLEFRSSHSINLNCENEVDRFSASNNNLKAHLDYPVGLLSSSEGNLIGREMLDSYQTCSNCEMYTMTPYKFGFDYGTNLVIKYDGSIGSINDTSSRYLRPVITIDGGANVVSGDGTASYPFAISIN